MKYLFCVVLAGLVLISSCGGGGNDPGPSNEETEGAKALATMSASAWTMKGVTVDGVAKNDLYTGLKLTINSTGAYTATNGGAVWTSGTITVSTDGKSFTRSDGTPVSIDALSASAMTLSLTWSKNTVGTGRTSSVAGKHVFTFGK